MNPTPVARPRVVFSEQQNLADIRSRSCYKTLRFVIGFTFVVCAAGSAAWPFYLAIFESKLPIQKAALLAVGFAAIMLCIAGRQILLLLVDIADTLISSHNRNRNR